MALINIFIKSIKWLLYSAFLMFFIGLVGIYILYIKYEDELPDTDNLRNVQYQTPLNILSRDGRLIAQFGEKKRIPISFDEAPETLIDAFIAAEDTRFFEHPGVDYQGLIRASLQLLLTGQKKQGGSTITMQVTRNYLLSREKTYTRKIKEIFLALKIEKELSKSEILELYINKIFLGHNAYGVAAAAQIYYGKPLAELTTPQFAMIAGLPKAPSTSNPISNPKKALKRRNYVLKRMFKTGKLSKQEFQHYKAAPISARKRKTTPELMALHVAEMVRAKIYQQYGEKSYSSGLTVYTTINPDMQQAANNALHFALHEYDERHGYRGNNPMLPINKVIGDTLPAIVEQIDKDQITASLTDQTLISITWQNLKWARPFKGRNHIGRPPRTASDIVKKGEAIRVRKLHDGSWRLAQVPEAEGAMVAINPTNGAILALTGGFDFNNSHFNRAYQSKRQPGSGFKPILYTKALEAGYTAASSINDAPIVLDAKSHDREWRPKNYSGKFYGPTLLRTALRKSRNLVSIRLMRDIGIDEVVYTAKRFGLSDDQLPKSLSLSLGSGHATPLDMAKVYAAFANGGFRVEPYLIDRVENAQGETLFQAQPRIACDNCDEILLSNPIYGERIMSPQVNFIMNSLLRDVVKRGTAVRAMQLGRNDLAGKTGTTNDQRDAWFNGFVPSLAAVAWVGFDNAKPLGRRETGGQAALPMWMHFMKTVLSDIPEAPLTPPPGIVSKLIDPNSGYLAAKGSGNGIWEFFRSDLAPKHRAIPSFYAAEAEDATSGELPVESLF